MRRSDIVFTFSYLHWDGAQQRGMSFAQDRLVQTLLHHERVQRLLVSNWFRGVPAHLVRRAFPRNGARFPTTRRARLHEPVRVRRSDPMSLRGIEKAYRRFDHSLEGAAAKMGLNRPAVITMHPLVAGFAPLEWAGPVTFYASDDWTAPGHRFSGYGTVYEEAYRRVREKGLGVCAVSQPILDRLRPAGPSVVVPNGIDPTQWTGVAPGPSWFTALPGPRLLYVGSLDDRIDVELVAQAAAAVPEGSIVLVGRMPDEAHFARLRHLGNVHVHERLPHASVPGLIAAADACMIPHSRNKLTQAMSPLKLYEYLAAGKPVVSVDLPPIRHVSPRVVEIAEDGDFGAGARRALSLGPAPEGERRDFLDANSWRRRHETILELALRQPQAVKAGVR